MHRMKVLLVSADPDVREQMAVTARSVRRRFGPLEPFEVLEAADGVEGIRMAWRHRPAVVVADEITSRAGAFALTRELKGAEPPFPGKVLILLDRSQDEWLARWAEADGWFVKPFDPFELGEAVGSLAVGDRVDKEAG
jgi:DNA-binding NarL/FixJ family response regulator